jgi:hypothetical protein
VETERQGLEVIVDARPEVGNELFPRSGDEIAMPEAEPSLAGEQGEQQQ